MNYIFKFLFFMHTINFITLYGAAAAEAAPKSEATSATTAGDFLAQAPAARAALHRTNITSVLYPIIFDYLATKKYEHGITFPDIRYKYATTLDGKGFYATNPADTLSHYRLNGTVTPLKENFNPDGYIPEHRPCPRKSWIINNYLMTIALYQRDNRDYHWHVSSTNLNHTHATTFLRLQSEYTPAGIVRSTLAAYTPAGTVRSTPAAPLSTGLAICDEDRFALHNPSDLKVTREFTRPRVHSHPHSLKRINDTQFIGQFRRYDPMRREGDSPNHFYHYDAGQSAPLHSFAVDNMSWPRIFPCLDQSTAFITDRDGILLHCDHAGATRKDYKNLLNFGYQATIHLLRDGSGFIAHKQMSSINSIILRVNFATPNNPKPIKHSALMPGLHRLRSSPLPDELLGEYINNVATLNLTNNIITTICPLNPSEDRMRATPQGLLVRRPGRVEFYSKRSSFEFACQAPSESHPKKPALLTATSLD